MARDVVHLNEHRKREEVALRARATRLIDGKRLVQDVQDPPSDSQ